MAIPCNVQPGFSFTVYPCALDSSEQLPITVDGQTPVKAEVVNRQREAILAIESELGINPSSTYTTVRARLDALEALIDAGGGGGAIIVYNEGVEIDAVARSLDFVGSGVHAVSDGLGHVTVTVEGGGVDQVQETLEVTVPAQTSFTLSESPEDSTAVQMFVNGIKQQYGSDYSVIDTAVSYLSDGIYSLSASDDVEFWYLVEGSGGGGGGGGSITVQEEGVDVDTNTTTINFIGSGVEVLPGISGTVDVHISGDGYQEQIQESIAVSDLQTTINLSETPIQSTAVQMFINGLKQEYGVDYNVVDDVAEYTGTPSLVSSDVVEFHYITAFGGDFISTGIDAVLATARGATNTDTINVVYDAVSPTVNLENIQLGTSKVAIGVGTPDLADISAESVVIGSGAMGSASLGFSTGNIAIGHNAMASADNGGGPVLTNIAIGTGAMSGGTVQSSNNIGIGYLTLNQIASGSGKNIAMGFGALGALQTGDGNVVIGSSAASTLTTGSGNVIIGETAGEVSQGTGNVLVGKNSALDLQSGDLNTIIGVSAGGSLGVTGGSNNVLVGALVDVPSDGTSNYASFADVIVSSDITGPIALRTDAATDIDSASTGYVLAKGAGGALEFVASSGGGGSLQETLSIGNTTDGYHIVMSSGDFILDENVGDGITLRTQGDSGDTAGSITLQSNSLYPSSGTGGDITLITTGAPAAGDVNLVVDGTNGRIFINTKNSQGGTSGDISLYSEGAAGSGDIEMGSYSSGGASGTFYAWLLSPGNSGDFDFSTTSDAGQSGGFSFLSSGSGDSGPISLQTISDLGQSGDILLETVSPGTSGNVSIYTESTSGQGGAIEIATISSGDASTITIGSSSTGSGHGGLITLISLGVGGSSDGIHIINESVDAPGDEILIHNLTVTDSGPANSGNIRIQSEPQFGSGGSVILRSSSNSVADAGSGNVLVEGLQASGGYASPPVIIRTNNTGLGPTGISSMTLDGVSGPLGSTGFIFSTGAGFSGGSGGYSFTSGAGNTLGSGGFNIVTGSGDGATSGEFSFTSGNASAAESGSFTVITGNNSGGTNSGKITLITGTANGGNGGNIELFPGISTSGTDGYVDIAGDVYISGKLNVTGLIDPTGLVLNEQAVAPYDTTTTGTEGLIWVRDDNNLIFTDQTGADSVVGPESQVVSAKVAAYTVALSDRGTFSPHTSVTDFDVELPSDADIPCPINFEFGGYQGGAGRITFDAGAGATVIYQQDGGNDMTTTKELGSPFVAKKVAANTWYVCGNMAVP